MLESYVGNKFSYTKLSPEEQKQRGILGRLVGVIADTVNPTRNGRRYSAELWDKVFQDPIMQERIANRCCFGEIEHPADGRSTIDPEKVAICLAEVPKKNNKGQLMGVFDILSTPNGKILKTMLDYGTTVGVSSRGEGDVFTDYDGQEAVDPDSYSCLGWDCVLLPAVKEARMQYVTESLQTEKSLAESLNELVENASEEDKKIMEETINNLNLNNFPTEQELKSVDNLKDIKRLADKYKLKVADLIEPALEANKDRLQEDVDQEQTSEEVGNAESDVNMIDELQEALKTKQELEANLIELQEKLSVCYAKEAKQEDKIGKLNKAISNLTESAKKLPALEGKVEELSEQLNIATKDLSNSNSKLSKLQENGSKLVATKKSLSEELNEKTETINSLNTNITQLNESIAEMSKDIDLKTSQYSRKLSKANKLVEKYQKIAANAVNRYIESQALKIGCNVNEIKNKLPESYTFDDIDSICEDVQSLRLQMSSLPFATSKLPKTGKVEVKKTVVESVLHKTNDEDDIDSELLSLAKLI